jgi:hypothetical protein
VTFAGAVGITASLDVNAADRPKSAGRGGSESSGVGAVAGTCATAAFDEEASAGGSSGVVRLRSAGSGGSSSLTVDEAAGGFATVLGGGASATGAAFASDIGAGSLCSW